MDYIPVLNLVKKPATSKNLAAHFEIVPLAPKALVAKVAAKS